MVAAANDEAGSVFGRAPLQLVGRSVADLFGAPLQLGHSSEQLCLLRSPSRVRARLIARPVDESPEWSLVAVIPERERDHARFELAVEAAPNAMIMTDASGRILVVNGEAERLLGWSRHELIGQPVELLVPERHRSDHVKDREGFTHAPARRPMGHGRDLRARRKDGSDVEVEIGLMPLDSPDGPLVLSSIVDVTARRESSRALRESEERFRLLVDGVHDYALVLLDAEGRVIGWNLGAERLTGYAGHEILGHPDEVFFPREACEQGLPREIRDRASREGRFEGEVLRVRKDGSSYLCHLVVTALTNPDGSPRGFASISHDVTEQRQLEDAMRQAQKLHAIGTLAGGIAHDFNNILTAIVGYTEMARAESVPDTAVADDLGRVLTAAERGRELVRRILAFSRRQDTVRAPLRVEAPVQETLDLLRATLPSTIEFRMRFDANLSPVVSDPMLIHQIVMNLGTNAAQAMGEAGGVLEVTLDGVAVGEIAARRVKGLAPGHYVRLRVSDTGHGIPSDVLAHVLEPFFTTKPEGSGTGLGLSVVNGIVDQHAGAMDIRSAPGLGTTVDVFLPAAPSASAAASGSPDEVTRGHGEHILLVDDEEAIATLSRRQLESLGYRVTSFTSSLAALEAFRRQPETFDLVITDNTMPVMTGLAFASAVQEVRPGVPVLMVSGFGEGVDVATIARCGVRRLLPKPYSLLKLSEAVAQVLADRA